MKKLTYTDHITPNSCVAIGDVHGRSDLFRAMMEKLRGSNATVISLGDLIDRGPDDIGVLELARDLLYDPESWGLHSFYVLRGNHEQMLLNALDYSSGWGDWVRNGGAVDKISELERHSAWIRGLPYYLTVGETLFSHAGVLPGEDPANYMHSEYMREEFVWQRSITKSGAQLSKWTDRYKKVVFGHTPQFVNGSLIPEPYEVEGGVCIDSGAVYTGVLTAYNASTDCYLQVSD